MCVCGGDGTVKHHIFSVAICLEWRCKCMSMYACVSQSVWHVIVCTNVGQCLCVDISDSMSF